jgi:hypothetical protein
MTYLKEVKNDILERLKEYPELREKIADDYIMASHDNITGNMDGSYYCSTYKATERLKEADSEDWDTLLDMMYDIGYVNNNRIDIHEVYRILQEGEVRLEDEDLGDDGEYRDLIIDAEEYLIDFEGYDQKFIERMASAETVDILMREAVLYQAVQQALEESRPRRGRGKSKSVHGHRKQVHKRRIRVEDSAIHSGYRHHQMDIPHQPLTSAHNRKELRDGGAGSKFMHPRDKKEFNRRRGLNKR